MVDVVWSRNNDNLHASKDKELRRLTDQCSMNLPSPYFHANRIAVSPIDGILKAESPDPKRIRDAYQVRCYLKFARGVNIPT
jgi:hypothetical protein